MKKRRIAISPLSARFLSYLALFIFSIFAFYPITCIITIALRPGDQLLSTSLAFLPAGATLANFRILLTEMSFLR